MLAEKEITKALGGPRVLGRGIQSPFDFAEAILKGLPSKSVYFLQKLLCLDDKDYSSALGVSSKWLTRYRNTPTDHINPNVSDRLYRIAKIYALAEEVLENKDAATNWLHRPQTGLGERVPLVLLSTDVGSKEVEELLYRIEYGILS